MARFLLPAAFLALAASTAWPGHSLAGDERAAADDKKTPPFEPRMVHKIQGHTAGVMCVAYSPDGKLLATASKDKTVRIWDAKTGERTQRIPNQEEAYCVAFSPDGKQVVVGSFGGAVNVFDVATGDRARGMKAGNSVGMIRWSPDGKILAVVLIRAHEVVFLDAETGKAVSKLTGHTGDVNNLAFSPDGKVLATVSHDSTIRLWDTASGKEKDSLKAHDGHVHGVAFSPDGKTLLTGGNDNTVVRWDTKTGNIIKPVMEIPAEKNGGFCVVAALPGGRVWAATGHGGHAVFDQATGRVLARKPSFDGTVFYSGGRSYWGNTCAPSPDGKTFAVAGENNVFVWDASKPFGTDKPAAARQED